MASSLKLSVRRRDPRLISPANPTPREFKILSDIDDQGSLRHQTPTVQFYGRDAAMGGRDPASVVSEALARVLVFYYPFAGRIRERSEGKLVVETTGEGVLFIEGDADVSLEEFGELQPPCPCLEELLYDVPGAADIVGCPLLLIQVTRLTCGGFVFALRMNHVISDGAGIGQFMNALGELARGAVTPSILPVWQRDLLTARHPPRPIFPHPEYVEETVAAISGDKIERCFFFGAKEMQALRSQLPSHLLGCSRYELLAASLWRARTAALALPPELEVKLLCVVNARDRYSPPLPAGYYGNAIGLPTAISTAGELSQTPLGKVVEMVRETVAKVDDEYMRSVADELVAKGRPKAATIGAYHISDLTGHGFEKVDFGWGRPVYGGIARVGVDPGVASFHISCRRKGEEGVMVPTCLPERAMGRFLEELRIQTSGLIGV